MRFQDLIATGLFVFTAMIFGREIQHWSKVKIRESALKGAIPGMALMGIVFHGLGSIEVLHRGILLFLPSVVFLRRLVSSYLQGNFVNRIKAKRIDLRIPRSGWILCVLGVIVLEPIFSLSIRIQDSYDALAYQMYAPVRAMFQTHSFNANDLVANAGLPVGAGSLHGWLVAFGLKPLSGVATFVFSSLLILVITDGQDRFATKLMKLLSVFGVVYSLGNSVYGSVNSDLALALFVAYVISQTEQESNKKICTQSVIVLAFIPLIKPFAIILSLSLVLSIGRKTRESKLRLLMLSASVSFPYLFWCVKNYLQVGNPFFPMFQKFFGGPGYGAEAMTLESDVRRSFTQFAEVMQQLIIDPTYAFLNYSNWLIFPCLVAALLINHLVNRKRFSNIGNYSAVWFSIAIGALIAGPVGRYALYGLVALTLYGILAYDSQTRDRLLTRSRRAMVTVSAASLVFVSVTMGLPNFIDASVISENKPQSDLEVLGVQKAVLDLIPKESAICTIGDSRGFLFYPRLVHAFENNRRNPFSRIRSDRQTTSNGALKLSGCDFLVLHLGWGFPRNIDTMNMKTWTLIEEAIGRQIYNSQNWQIFYLNE